MDSRPPRADQYGADHAGAAAPPTPPAAAATGQAAPVAEGAAAAPDLPKIIPFQSLARCGEEIWIENGGQVYRLRRTRQGKLILTK